MTTVRTIPIAQIRVLNPRARSKAKFREIVANIERLGLKRPVTVSPRGAGEEGYDLVCGQGRLEAYLALGQTEVPAVVVEVPREDRLLMGLVENLARRTHSATELVQQIEALEARGYTPAQVAAKVDLSEAYVTALLRLLRQGEARLLEAVQRREIPPSVAIQIAATDDEGAQRALHDAYEKGLLRGPEIRRARRLLEQRRTKGAARPREEARPAPEVTAEQVSRAYCREVQRQERLVMKARRCEEQLLFVVTALRELLMDREFVRVLRAEKLDALPKALAERLGEA